MFTYWEFFFDLNESHHCLLLSIGEDLQNSARSMGRFEYYGNLVDCLLSSMDHDCLLRLSVQSWIPLYLLGEGKVIGSVLFRILDMILRHSLVNCHFQENHFSGDGTPAKTWTEFDFLLQFSNLTKFLYSFLFCGTGLKFNCTDWDYVAPHRFLSISGVKEITSKIFTSNITFHSRFYVDLISKKSIFHF